MTEHNADFYQEEYEEYMRDTPLVARFDPMTIQLLVTEAVPRHAAYGMMFDEYAKQRSRFTEYDDSEKKRLSFYFQRLPSRVSSDLAFTYKTSHHRFMILIIELGLITFHVDYHDEYNMAKTIRKKVFDGVETETNLKQYMQIEKQTIELGSGAGRMQGSTKHFVPSVPEWLYNAVTDASIYLNMSISDFTYLCWCIGVRNNLPDSVLPKIMGQKFDDTINTFNFELNEYIDSINIHIDKMEKTRLLLTPNTQ